MCLKLLQNNGFQEFVAKQIFLRSISDIQSTVSTTHITKNIINCFVEGGQYAEALARATESIDAMVSLIYMSFIYKFSPFTLDALNN